MTNLFPIHRCVRNTKSICMCICLFTLFWRLTNGNETYLKLHPNEETIKLSCFFLQHILEFPLVKLRLKANSEHCQPQRVQAPEFGKKTWVECKITFKKHQVVCLKTWEEKSMTFPVSVHWKLASSWTHRTMSYARFLPFWW